MRCAQPRTSQISTIPNTADAMPAIRSEFSGLSNAVAANRFGGARKGGEKQPFDHEYETDRNNELGHLCLPVPCSEVPLLLRRRSRRGRAAGCMRRRSPSRGLPDGSTKKRKNSESGLSSMRVSLERRPAS